MPIHMCEVLELYLGYFAEVSHKTISSTVEMIDERPFDLMGIKYHLREHPFNLKGGGGCLGKIVLSVNLMETHFLSVTWA